jgi:hypothetical protein
MGDQAAKKQLIYYLLGGLRVEERRQIEERYFDDDAFFQEMLIIEEELIDSYVNHELSAEEAEQFEKHYLTTPERYAQVEFASVLTATLSRLNRHSPPDEAHAPTPGSAGLFAALRAHFRPWRWRFITALAVVVLLLLGTISLWLRSQARRLEQERALLLQQRQETDRLNERLERDLKRLEQARNRVESLPLPASGSTKIAIGTLLPMLTRSEETGQIITISPQITLLLLQVPVESAAKKTYQVVLTQDTIEVLRLNHLPPQSGRGGNIIEIPLTAAMLNGRLYVLTVKPDDSEDAPDIYPFELRKR